MAGQKDNMFGSFGSAAEIRKQDQQEIKAAVLGEEKPRKRGANATTMTLAISQEDKQLVKSYAAKKSVTVSDLLHYWINEYCKD